MAFGAHRAAALRRYQKENTWPFEAPPASLCTDEVQLEIINTEQRHEIAPGEEHLGQGQSFPLHPWPDVLHSLCTEPFDGLMMMYLCITN